MRTKLYLLLLISCGFILTSIYSRNCDPLNPNQHVDIKCWFLNVDHSNGFGSPVNCSSASLEVGTIVSYNCKQYHVPIDTKLVSHSTETELRCLENGVWQGHKKFLAFRCKEGNKLKAALNLENCGRPLVNAKPLVINGVPTYRSLHPWHAMLFFDSGKDGWIYLCGGSIIRTQIVLTAAHCVTFDRRNLHEPNKNYRVVLGGVHTNFSRNTVANGAQIYTVQRIFVSENYDPKNGYKGDIAIIRLDDVIQYNDFIRPICLPNDYSVDVSAIRKDVQGQIAGFGLTEEHKVPESLRVIQLTVKSNSECYNSLQRVISESQYCAGSKSEETFKTVCNGDSGNGMVFASPLDQKFYVHGIVSSSDSDASKGVCQNVAAFTRVYQFGVWIRDVIEEVSGEAARDLAQNVPYPYFFHGSEVKLKSYLGLPREWENRITHLELRYVYAQFDEILNSLEHAKPINTIRFSQIILGGNIFRISRRLVLPVLSQFQVDILQPELKFGNDRKFPLRIDETFIKSYLFFDKDYNQRDWSISQLLSLKTDIDLTIHIFRILHVNAAHGEVFLNQAQFADEVFKEYNQNTEFNLKILALHRTAFNISLISSASHLNSLILHRTQLGSAEISSALSRFPNLKYLVLDLILKPGAEKFLIGIDDFPESLEYLTLSSAIILTERNPQNNVDFRFIFPDHHLVNRKHVVKKSTESLNKLHAFCCDNCFLEKEIWVNFDKKFPNLKTLVIRSDEMVSLEPLLLLPSLEFLQIENNKVKNYSNFAHLDSILDRWNSNILARPLLRFVKRNGFWQLIPLTPFESFRSWFACYGGKYFWTSEEDYLSKLRLKTYEREALNSGHFFFNGSMYGAEFGRRKIKFNGIPYAIQSGLKTIAIHDVEVTPRILSASIEKCGQLKTLTLINAAVLGNGKRYTFTTENLTLTTEAEQFTNVKFEYSLEYVNGKFIAANVPFQHIGKFNETRIGTNTISRLFRHISSARLTDTSCSMYILDSTVEELRASTAHIRKLITALPESHILKPVLGNLLKQQMYFKNGLLPPEFEFNGLQIVDNHMVERFYKDSAAKVFGNLGILKVILRRFGKYLQVASLSLTALQNQTSTFPPVQAISLSIIKDAITSSQNS